MTLAELLLSSKPMFLWPSLWESPLHPVPPEIQCLFLFDSRLEHPVLLSVIHDTYEPFLFLAIEVLEIVSFWSLTLAYPNEFGHLPCAKDVLMKLAIKIGEVILDI